jgi:hypothetical protein
MCRQQDEEDLMHTQLTLDALAVIGAATVASCVLGLATVGAIDTSRWLLARLGRAGVVAA